MAQVLFSYVVGFKDILEIVRKAEEERKEEWGTYYYSPPTIKDNEIILSSCSGKTWICFSEKGHGEVHGEFCDWFYAGTDGITINGELFIPIKIQKVVSSIDEKRFPLCHAERLKDPFGAFLWSGENIEDAERRLLLRKYGKKNPTALFAEGASVEDVKKYIQLAGLY